MKIQAEWENAAPALGQRHGSGLCLALTSLALLSLISCSGKMKVSTRVKQANAITSTGSCPGGHRTSIQQVLSGDEISVYFADPSIENCVEVNGGDLKGLTLTLPPNSFAPDLRVTATYDQSPISLSLLQVAFLRSALKFFNLESQPKLVLKGDHALMADMTVRLPDLMTAGLSAQNAENLSLTMKLEDNTLQHLNSEDFVLDDASGSLVYKTKLWATTLLQLDTTPPSASLSSPLTGPTNATRIPIKVLWSETVKGFSADDVTVNGATIQDFAGDGQTFTFNLSPSVSSGSISLSVGAGSVKDLVGHANKGEASFAILYDGTPPMATLASMAPAATSVSPMPITLSFSKSVTGLTLADLVVSNGIASALTGSGANYAFDVTPAANGVVTVDLPAAAVNDAVGNANPAATQLTRIFNSNLATTVLSSTTGSATNTSPIPVTVTFSTDVTGFDLSDIAVTGGLATNFSGSGAVYTCDVTPSGEGTVRVNVGGGVATTVNTGDDNSAASELAIAYDTTPPGVVISSTTAATTNASPIPVKIVFSKPVTGFVAGDVTMSGGGISNFAGSGTTYTFDVTPVGQGALTVDVASGVAQDNAGNMNTAAASLSRTYDSLGPTVVISSTTPATTNVAPMPVTVTFGEAVTGFTLGDITVSGGSKSNFAGSGTTYTFDLTPSGQGALTVDVATNVAQDNAGNGNAAAAQLLRTYDAIAPVAGNGGLLSLSAAATDVMTVSWGKATDDLTAQAGLQYELVYATTPSLTTLSGAQAGSVATAWTADIAAGTISGLSLGTKYYVNVMVKDGVGNIGLYAQATFVPETGSPYKTALAQRKTFQSQGVDWAFWFGGQSVHYGTSTDHGATWNELDTLPIGTWRYSVAEKNGTAFIVYESANDIYVRRASLTSSSATWETAVLALDASGANDFYSRPSVAIGNDGSLYIAAYRQNGGVLGASVAQSTSTYDATLNFSAPVAVGATGSALGELALIPQGTAAMLVMNQNSRNLEAYQYNGSSWQKAAGNVADWFSYGQRNFNYLMGTGVNASIRTIAVMGSDIYVGGDFTNVGANGVSFLAKWNGSSWSAVGTGVNFVVRTLAVSGTDLYVGGDFTTAGGSAANHIAKWDGSAWSALGAGLGDTVNAIAISGTDLYVGGFFTTAGGSAANHMAKWDGSAWSALGAGVGDTVYALAVTGTDLYVGGDFTTAGGSAANHMAKWDGSAWSALGAGLGDAVYAFAITGTDLYVGGSFTTAGGSAANHMAKWNGSAWSALGAGVDSYVNAIAVSGTDLYVGGAFTNAGGSSAARIAKWNGSAWSALGAGVDKTVNAIVVSGAEFYVGGSITTAGGLSVSNIALWNGSTWSTMGSGGVDGIVNALAVSGSDVYMGGDFTTTNGLVVNGIVKWDGTTWSALGAGVDNTVNALAVSGTDLYAAGSFTTAGGSSASYVAKWNGSAWSALGSGVISAVNALAISGTDLYVGGSFFLPAARIAKWNGSAWSALGSGVNGTVNAIAASGTDLYVGGAFTTAGGSPASKVAKWNGSAWSALGSGVNGTVNALAISGTDLYVGGTFTTADGSAANNIAKWNGSAWSTLGSGVNGTVNALAVSGSDLYVGGDFTTAGGSAANHIAKWDGSAWSALGSSLNATTRALTWDSSHSRLHSGGDFGASSYDLNFIATADCFSVTRANDAGANLAYVNQGDKKPYYIHYNGTSWESPILVNAATPLNDISFANQADDSVQIIAWEKAGTIQTVTATAGSWGSPSTITTTASSRFPVLPEIITGNYVPLIWSSGSSAPFSMLSAAQTAP